MYTELQVTTNFSFLRGASHPEELVQQAALLGYPAIGISDRNTLAGVVRAHAAARRYGVRVLPGCRLDLQDGPSLLAYPEHKAAYSQLSNLLTTGNLRAEKGQCHLYRKDIFEHAPGIQFILIPPSRLNQDFDFDPAFAIAMQEYRHYLGNRLSLAVCRHYHGDDAKQVFRLLQLGQRYEIPLVATNDVHYHHPSRRELHDVVTCIREKCTISTAGFHLHCNAERYLKPLPEMERLFRKYPGMLQQSIQIAEQCHFSLDELEYSYPREITPDGRSPLEELERLAWEGAHRQYGQVIPGKVCANIRHELRFIEEMNYAEYFLTVYDIVRFARSRNILCQGRGSAANSTICFCLGITGVDPTRFELLFERFISSARNEPPDIDVDFEHERREEVMQYIYQKYGRDRAAIVATVTQQHQKGAVRDVGKAMGLSGDTITMLSASVWKFTEDWFGGEQLRAQGLNPDDPHLRKVLELTQAFMGFPRQLGQHTGGFVITDGKLSDLCPILNARMEDRTCIEWNKDDIDALGFLKIDILALGMLTCIRKAFDKARDHYGLEWTLANFPQDDKKVYEMISHADTIGVFQIESRAQQSMLPRLRPNNFYDLVIEVAIVRPGPIQGDMVHPYLRRRNGLEPVDYPSPELKNILERTLGVPLFQEQAMKIAMVAAGFTPAEADELRRSMATFKAKGMVTQFEQKLIRGMTERGYSKEYAMRVFRQLEGFGSYGFPESHAASFASLVYISSWIKCYYPDVFACAILNSQPMGFYQPAQLISDARKHGVTVREVDINFSAWDYTLEEKAGEYLVLRVGFRQVKGLKQEEIDLLVNKRGTGYRSINELRDAGIAEATLELLADADAFRSIGLNRREALWEIAAKDKPQAIFKGQPAPDAAVEQVKLPEMTLPEHVLHDYAATSLSLKAHPVSFVRDQLTQLHIIAADQLGSLKDGMPVKVAGLVLVRQRPGTAAGICFMTIEDETGCANLVIFEKLFEQFRKEILQSKLIMVEGKVQIEGEVIHVIVQRCHNFSRLLRKLHGRQDDDMPILTLSRADEQSAPTNLSRKIQAKEYTQEKLFPEARNFK